MPRVFSDLTTLGYHTPGHPETPARVGDSHKRLKAAGHDVLLPTITAAPADVGLVHADTQLKTVETGAWSDGDTPHYPTIKEFAMTSLSGALSAAASAAEM